MRFHSSTKHECPPRGNNGRGYTVNEEIQRASYTHNSPQSTERYSGQISDSLVEPEREIRTLVEPKEILQKP